MTEEIPATPGWVDEQLDALFAHLPGSPDLQSARMAYSMCLAMHKRSAVPSDTLGAEFKGCRAALLRALQAAGVAWESIDTDLDAVEAEIAASS
jgi:hypothetical protein